MNDASGASSLPTGDAHGVTPSNFPAHHTNASLNGIVVTAHIELYRSSVMVATVDDFHVGQHASFSKTFIEEDVDRFVAITGDANPLHVDEEFAATTSFGRRILQGMLTASLFSTMVGMRLPGPGAVYRSQTLRFLRPVFIGDTVIAHFKVRSIDRAKHRMEIESWIEKENGERVIEGTCEVGFLRG